MAGAQHSPSHAAEQSAANTGSPCVAITMRSSPESIAAIAMPRLIGGCDTRAGSLFPTPRGGSRNYPPAWARLSPGAWRNAEPIRRMEVGPI